MYRNTLRSFIHTAASEAGCSETEVARLVGAADEIERVAIGSYEIVTPGFKCGCPATVAGYFNPMADDGVDPWSEDASRAVRSFPRYFDIQFSSGLTKKTAFFEEYLPVED